jgi:hypothetical protein
MKPNISHNTPHMRALVVLGTLAVLMITLACSSSSTPVVQAAPASTPVKGETAGGVANSTSGKDVQTRAAAAVKPSAQPVVYRSRDYGVSFTYPWQYMRLSARTVANNPDLRPRTDGTAGQLTLVRVEVPKGYYPDTDFERGYFMLSLNQELNEQQCQASLGEGKTATETINGVEYRWAESDSGGRGSASKVRNYVAFTNGACYELELGVRTSNPDGLAREVDPDLVMQRLDAILRTVEIMPSLQSAPKVASAGKSD